MEADADLAGTFTLGSEIVLLFVAVGIAVIFLCYLVYDIARRRKRRARHQRESEGLRTRLLKPYHRARTIQGELGEMLHERSRRKERDRRKPPETPS